ncbi:hypothetical protein EDB87DRAFT_1616966 [Lactarius vividus]|nr:hypothetical protein EDB87DRAFT_1616966 [Lactarius vividus]
MISGAITPLFSYVLSRLLFEVSQGAQDVSVINTFGGVILAAAIADGLCRAQVSRLRQLQHSGWPTCAQPAIASSLRKTKSSSTAARTRQ